MGIKGFTLIELLVVIAVIALLIAVILPALNSAKLSAKQVVCAAQMKQWSLAALAYASENNDELVPYADVRDVASGNAVNPETYWHKRLSPYLTKEDYGKWGMDDVRKCPMGKENWGEKAVWIGVYYGSHKVKHAPFIFLNQWDGNVLTNMTTPFKVTTIKTPANYLMLLDVIRDHTFNPFFWTWDADYNGDGINDSNSGLLPSRPYNMAKPRIHRGGCNVALFDGHVEWIRYETFWDCGADGYPTHQYWYNQNHP